MNGNFDDKDAGVETPRRLFVYNGGFLTQPRIRRILQLSGYAIKLGKPQEGDSIGVWGQSPTSPRGEAVADKTETPIVRVEDAFLRSVLPGRSGQPPIGLTIDTHGVHFDGVIASDLEIMLARGQLDDTALLNRARAAMARMKAVHLSKYTAFDPTLPVPEPGYVLVIDQTRDDASVLASKGNNAVFREMLVIAQEENPGARVYIKTHPETNNGHRQGYYSQADETGNVRLLSDPVSPWHLLEGATAVYTLSSQFGFEAIIAGHQPKVFGQPFYGGWGLTDDRNPVPRRMRKLTRPQLFATAMILYPKWYDPYRDRLCQLETALDTLEAQTRNWREDQSGFVATGMRLWKRGSLQEVFGRYKKLKFENDPDKAVALAASEGRGILVWAGQATPELETAAKSAYVPVVRIEDGFIRSRGLGAKLVPPLSLACDDLGVYYDPNRESRLERLISDSCVLPEAAILRAEALVKKLVSSGLSKYNVGRGALPELPTGHRILVAGQVEDDASVLSGCGEIRTNLGLLQAARAAHPSAVIVYKPHPDVEAGLRTGAVEIAAALRIADVVVPDADPIALIDEIDEVWTMTSLIGFEALLRGKPVTCLGAPFYAGWGLTTDRGQTPDRRKASPTLFGLAHAALIDYPRYIDPVSKEPCPPEVVVDRLANMEIPPPGPFNRALSKLQGALATYAYLWRSK